MMQKQCFFHSLLQLCCFLKSVAYNQHFLRKSVGFNQYLVAEEIPKIMFLRKTGARLLGNHL